MTVRTIPSGAGSAVGPASLAADLLGALDPASTFSAAVGSSPEPWQQRVLFSAARKGLLLTARQVGKSTTTAVKAADTALYEPGSLILIVSPSQRQSDETLAKVRTVLRRAASVTGNASEVRTEAGSRVVSLPATESTTRGFSAARLLIFDEAARVPDDVFIGALPMVAADGQVVALSTPGARVGWFYEAWTDPVGWERHKVTVHESARYSEARIEELRRSLGGRQFRAEYMCEFVGLSESAFDPDRVEAAFRPDVRPIFGGPS
jgi:hypothetical protein